MKRTLKVLAVGVAVAVVLLAVGLVVVYLSFGAIVKKGAETMGPRILGAPVHLEKVEFSLFRGSLDLQGLVVGNPEGFNTDSAFRLGRIRVKLQPASLFGDTVRIERVLIDSPEVTYEMGLKGSNIGAIKKNVEAFGGGPSEVSGKKPPETPKGEAGAGKKFIIDDFRFTGGKVNLSATFLKGGKAAVPLPEIHLTDIGKASGGKSIGETVAEIAKAITDAVAQAASGAARGLAAGGAQLKGGAETAGKVVKKSAARAVNNLRGIFRRK
ncbi:MAG: hypothetical protein GXP31_14655 [Kiritimatiellaeota bacterium]|nr:hypothetical protein [Kiritimatiellota bacterium]